MGMDATIPVHDFQDDMGASPVSFEQTGEQFVVSGQA